MLVMVRVKALARWARWVPAATAILTLQLSACAVGPQADATADASPRPSSKPKEVMEPVVEPRALPTEEGAKTAEEPKLARRTPAEPRKTPTRAPQPPLSLNSLIGLDQEAATTLVGQPNAVVERPPAIVWEYHDPSCALKLSFFLEVQQKSYRVLTVDVDGTDGSELADQACLDTIRDRELTRN